MSNILFANNAATVLAAPISSGATACVLATGTGPEFPSPTGGQYFMMTFIDAATGLLNEIVKVTARSADTCTIVRAQEGTTALSWLAGDFAENLLTAGSIAALQSGFPTGTNHYTANTTLSISDSGNFIRVGGTAVIITLPAASSVSGMPVGIFAGNACTVSIIGAGGNFAGGAINGQTSVTLSAGDFICIQSDGARWAVFSASPDILIGGPVALQSWVTANFDPLGAGATAQANAEAYALALTGNVLAYKQVVDANYEIVTADFGKYIAMISASASRTLTVDDGSSIAAGTARLYINSPSPTWPMTIRVKPGSSAKFFGPYAGLNNVTSFQITNAEVWIAWTGTNWRVSYYSAAFDVAGAAASALSVAEAYTDSSVATTLAAAEAYADHQALVNNIGPFLASSAVGVVISANYNVAISFTFTAPTKGVILAIGSINLAQATASGSIITALVSIAGATPSGDASTLAQTDMARVTCAAGDTITVTYRITNTAIASGTTATYRVAADYNPTL